MGRLPAFSVCCIRIHGLRGERILCFVVYYVWFASESSSLNGIYHKGSDGGRKVYPMTPNVVRRKGT